MSIILKCAKNLSISLKMNLKKPLDHVNPTIAIAKLVKDVVGILQGMRRYLDIRTQKKNTALKVIIDIAKNCDCCPTDKPTKKF